MKTIACHTLGCRVNQYDTQAMLELFLQDGYSEVSFNDDADVYLINTCTVTGTGDKKSLQLARHIRRSHPDSVLILCGCLAQKRGETLLKETGASLIIGTSKRTDAVLLLKQYLHDGKPFSAVEPIAENMKYESLQISRQSDHTRADLKIQEGCNNHCTYCTIPSVRGPIRSRPLSDIVLEARRLAGNGFRELVLTGIHLSSYGKDLNPPLSLIDVLRSIHSVEGVERIRLGSLEPTIASYDFAKELSSLPKVCPQFHLALQSGSDTVLARMARRYNTAMYLNAVCNLRSFFPDAAITSDILTGFPGETEEEFLQTVDFIRKIGFARIHVFPYSPRTGTKAAEMQGQLTSAVKEKRTRKLISVGAGTSYAYMHSLIGHTATVLLEENTNDTLWVGYTPEYIRVSVCGGLSLYQGQKVYVKLVSVTKDGMKGEMIYE